MRPEPRFAWLVLVMAASPAPLWAEPWPVPRGPSREPAPYQYDPKVLTNIPRAFVEDVSACILFNATTHLVDQDGTVETISHEITRFNGRKGIESLGEYRNIYFDPTYQKLTLNEARVIKANGKFVPIEPRHLQLRDVATDFQIYDQDKQLVISFPNLEIGDAYEVKWTVRGKNKEFGDHHFTRYTFGDDQLPVVRDELHVVVPKTKPLLHASINGKLEPKIHDLGARRHYAWRVDNRPELPKDEDRPSKEVLRLQVALSTYASWDEVGQWKQKLRAECWQCTPEIKKVVQDVAARVKTPLEKAQALTHWVKQHIRYVSRGPGGLGYTPHEPKRVLANLYGDCKDQTQLLAVMLKEVGLDPWLVTIGALDDGQIAPEVPSPWGSHALLMVPIEGKQYWIDTTVSQAPWDYLPKADRGRQAYLTRGKELKLLRTPPLIYRDNRFEQTTVVTVRPDGTSHCRRGLTFHGASALHRRDQWLEVPLGERRRLMTVELQDANPRSRLLQLTVDERSLLDFDKPVRAQVEFIIPRHFAMDKEREASFTDSNVWNRLLAYNLDLERKLPLVLGVPFESIHLYVVQLPPTMRFDGLPPAKTVTGPWGFFKLTVDPDAKDPRRLEMVMHLRLEKTQVGLSDFAAFQKFHEEVSKAYRVWLNLKPTQDLADAPALETLLALQPGGDPQTARALAKLYLQHEKWAEARRILKTARAFHYKESELWDLSIQAAANRAEEEQLYVEMIKHFPEESKYVLLLGETRVRGGDLGGARKVLEPLVTKSTGKVAAEAHLQLARGHYHDQQPQAALKHLEAGVRASSQIFANANAHQFKAKVLERLGQFTDAIQSYRRAHDLDADDLETLAALIRLEIQANQRSEALDHLRRYTMLSVKNLGHLTRAADYYWQLGRLDEASELANRARDLGFHGGAQRVLGLVHGRKGDFQQSVFHLDRAEMNAEARVALAAAHLALGQLDLAARAVDPAREVTDSPGMWLDRFQQTAQTIKELLARRDQFLILVKAPRDQASAWTRTIDAVVCADYFRAEPGKSGILDELVRKAFADKLEFGPAYCLRAELALEKGQLARALADAQRSLDLGLAEARSLLVRGRIRLERGNPEAALADLLRARNLKGPVDPWLYHFLASAFHQTGQLQEALNAQREAVRLRPAEVEFQNQLRDLEKARKG